MPLDEDRTAGESGHLADHDALHILYNAITSPWTDYTPVLTGSVTNPTLGTGSERRGRYKQIGKLVAAQFDIKFGSSGAAAGSGSYEISLPVVPFEPVSNWTMGSGWIYDTSADLLKQVTWVLNGGKIGGFLAAAATSAYRINSGNPWVWAQSDQIFGQLTYEAA